MKGQYITTKNYVTVNGESNRPRAGDRIWHKDTIDGVAIERIGIVKNLELPVARLVIVPAYTGSPYPLCAPREIADGLEWSLIQREEG